MKKYLFLAMSALALANCSNEDQEVTSPVGGEAAMISVNLKNAGTITKAATNTETFKYGTDDENRVNKIDFYFFDAGGNAYSVVSTGSNAITWTKKEPVESVAKVSDVVLVIKKHETKLPAKVVAVINSEVDYKSKPLSEMATDIVNEWSSNEYGFVMSNSVYADGEIEINATDILPENIFTANDADLDNIEPGQAINSDKVTSLNINPIDIYVERVAAKVEVTATTTKEVQVGENKIQLMAVYDEAGTTQLKDADNQDVYAKILGWDVTNTVKGANTLKDITPTWDNLGFTPWNNSELFRSYWANTPEDQIPAHTHSFASLTNSGAKYYFENTKEQAEENSVTPGEGNQAPQLLVAAQLVNKDGNAIKLAKWYNVLYTIDGLKTAMVNQIASKMYVKVETTTGEDEFAETITTYRTITASDVEFEQRAETTEDNRYEVIMVAKEDVEYYSPAEAKKNGTPMAEAEYNSIIAGVDPAQMWTEGYTYYYTDIKHFGDAFGMVRNHAYEINLTKIKGFGTPVYKPEHIITPERPDDQPAANIAAQINILSWALVSNSVELGS